VQEPSPGLNDDDMEYKFKNGELSFEKIASELDKLVFEFVSILESERIKYVIVSGYVAILMGRSRGTDDIDFFIEKLGGERFAKFYSRLEKSGFWVFNAEGRDDAFDMLTKHEGPRFAKKGDTVPNFELKFPESKIAETCLNNPLKATINGKTLLISSFEIQVPFKVKLGSDKDIEDATHIYQLFKENINKDLMNGFSKELGVEKKMIEYGFE
jgi:hypothetical protein